MSRYIDYKMEIWGRIHLPDEVTEEEAIEFVKSNLSGTEIFDRIIENHPETNPEFEFLLDTEESLGHLGNNGSSTIEYHKDYKIVAENGT